MVSFIGIVMYINRLMWFAKATANTLLHRARHRFDINQRDIDHCLQLSLVKLINSTGSIEIHYNAHFAHTHTHAQHIIINETVL